MTTTSSGWMTTQALTSVSSSAARAASLEIGRWKPSASPPPRLATLATNERRLSCGVCGMAISPLLRRRRGVDRSADPRIGAAAADIGDRRIDFGVARLRFLLQERRHRHDHAALTIAALRDIVGDP